MVTRRIFFTIEYNIILLKFLHAANRFESTLQVREVDWKRKRNTEVLFGCNGVNYGSCTRMAASSCVEVTVPQTRNDTSGNV